MQNIEAPSAPAGSPAGRTGSRLIAPPADEVNNAVARMGEAKRPIIIVGAGTRGSMAAITRLVTRIGAPIATTFKARASFPTPIRLDAAFSDVLARLSPVGS